MKNKKVYEKQVELNEMINAFILGKTIKCINQNEDGYYCPDCCYFDRYKKPKMNIMCINMGIFYIQEKI